MLLLRKHFEYLLELALNLQIKLFHQYSIIIQHREKIMFHDFLENRYRIIQYFPSNHELSFVDNFDSNFKLCRMRMRMYSRLAFVGTMIAYPILYWGWVKQIKNTWVRVWLNSSKTIFCKTIGISSIRKLGDTPKHQRHLTFSRSTKRPSFFRPKKPNRNELSYECW